MDSGTFINVAIGINVGIFLAQIIHHKYTKPNTSIFKEKFFYFYSTVIGSQTLLATSVPPYIDSLIEKYKK